jgi:hypothetical protein
MGLVSENMVDKLDIKLRKHLKFGHHYYLVSEKGKKRVKSSMIS